MDSDPLVSDPLFDFLAQETIVREAEGDAGGKLSKAFGRLSTVPWTKSDDAAFDRDPVH